MAEKVFDTIQLGKETVVGTEVAATTVYPGKASGPDLDRGYLNPDEDYGIISDSYPGRASWGIRGGSSSIESVARFEDLGHFLGMNLTASTAATGGANAYIYTYTADEDAYANDTYTVEMGSEAAQDQYTLTGCVVPELTLGFDALTAPGNSPWNMTAQLESLTRTVKAITAAQTPPTTLETIEGQYARIYEGNTSTAFDSLSELTNSLVSFTLTSTRPYTRRAYGSANDYASAWGLSGKAGVTFEAGIKVNANNMAATHDFFDYASSQVQERRWRIRTFGARTASQSEVQTFTHGATCDGGTFTLTFDGYTTGSLAWDISTADLQTALRALPSINGANITVTGVAGTNYILTFGGTLASLPQPLFRYDDTALLDGAVYCPATLVRTTPGGLLKMFTIDGRVRFNVVARGDREGESIYVVQGLYVHDATLDSRIQMVLQHATATLP